MMRNYKTWAEIDLDAAATNFNIIKETAKNSKVMAVVKADAYGHGAVELARLYKELGAEYLGVSSLDEALQLRNGGLDLPILILGYTPEDRAQELIDNDLTQTVFSLDEATKLSAEARKSGGKIKAHIKIDTGMSRLGFRPGASDDLVSTLKIDNIEFEGIFSHFAVADARGAGDEFTHIQFNRLMTTIDELAKLGFTFKLRHICNSAAILFYPEMHLDMVRAGVILCGVSHSGGAWEEELGFKQVMSLRSVISQVREIEEGTTVSYGRRFTAEGKTRMATIPIGYADGYMRCMTNRAQVLINGKRANQRGTICMDQMMADISNIDDAKPGDIVTLFGTDGNETITVSDVAELCSTITHEILCDISKRVPRVYTRGGKEVTSMCYISR